MTDFEHRVEKFNSFYLWLVVGVGALLLSAIISAIYIRVWLGLLIGICAAVAYTLLLGDELRRAFGVRYRRVSGGIALTVISPKGESEVRERRLPTRLMWLDVVAIDAPEKKHKPDTLSDTLHIPSSVTKIEENAFSEMTSLYRIVYEGTAEDWEKVSKGNELDMLYVEFLGANT